MGHQQHKPLSPTIFTSLSECHFFHVLTSPDPCHHFPTAASTLSLKKCSTKPMATTSSWQHFDFKHPIFDIGSSCPYLSPHCPICDCQSHTHLPSQFPCLPALCPCRLGHPTSSCTSTSHILSAQAPLSYTYTILTAAPLFQHETAMSLTGGEYHLPLACSHVLSPLPHSLNYSHHSRAVAVSQVSQPGACTLPACISAAHA